MFKVNIYKWDKSDVQDYMSHYIQTVDFNEEKCIFEILENIPISEARTIAHSIEEKTELNTHVFTRCEKKEITVLDHYYGPAWGYQYHTELQKNTVTCIAVAKKPFAKYRRLFY